MGSQHETDTKLFSPERLVISPHWPPLHSIILSAYKPTRPNWPLPKTFQRLVLDPEKAGKQLLEELGDGAVVAVAFDSEVPVACAAVQKFRTIRQSDFDTSGSAPHAPAQTPPLERVPDVPQQWELTLVTTSATHRNKGIARNLVHELEAWLVREHHATDLMVRTVEEISGAYWRKLGFEVVSEWCITLPKGMSHIEDTPEELRLERDVRLWAGRRRIESAS